MRAKLDLFSLQVWLPNPLQMLQLRTQRINNHASSLIGMAGLTISDRILGRDLGLKLRNRFERCLEEEFTECDGRILPIRSEFTGLTVSPSTRRQHRQTLLRASVQGL